MGLFLLLTQSSICLLQKHFMFGSEFNSLIVVLLSIVFLFIVLIGFVTLFVLQHHQRQNLYNRNLKEIEAIHLTELLKSQIEIQENTFDRISKEIHDNIGQKLSLAKLYLNTLDSTEFKNSNPRIQDSVQIIGEVISELSNLSRSMNPDLIANLGLVRAVETEINNLAKTGCYQIKLVVSGDSYFFEPEKELILFRITQEALNNIVKHARASAITLEFYYHRDQLEMLISDDGIGFQLERTASDGSGLLNMKKRTQVLNGQFDILTNSQQGTTIKINIPV
ncbi:MAG TPA: ATP-binding protein [Ferruginibacter sp.]|nr:ATP-binding protein [Ferruginibacter sp.]